MVENKMGGRGREGQTDRARDGERHIYTERATRQRDSQGCQRAGAGLGNSPVREFQQGTRRPTGPRDCPQPASILAESPLLFLKYHRWQGKGSVRP